jgi:hypothetical protein
MSTAQAVARHAQLPSRSVPHPVERFHGDGVFFVTVRQIDGNHPISAFAYLRAEEIDLSTGERNEVHFPQHPVEVFVLMFDVPGVRKCAYKLGEHDILGAGNGSDKRMEEACAGDGPPGLRVVTEAKKRGDMLMETC